MSTHKGIFKGSDLEKISSKLKFVGMLKPGQKISVSSTPSIQENTYWTSFVRTFTGESRERVYKFISDVISDSLNILEGLSNSSNDFDIQICKNLITDLIFLGPGLSNLQDTYKLDKMYVSKIKVLMENLEVKIRELCHKRDIDYELLQEEANKKMKELQKELEDQQVITLDGGSKVEIATASELKLDTGSEPQFSEPQEQDDEEQNNHEQNNHEQNNHDQNYQDQDNEEQTQQKKSLKKRRHRKKRGRR